MGSNVYYLETYWLWYRAASGIGWQPASGSHQPGTIGCHARRSNLMTNASLQRGRRLLVLVQQHARAPENVLPVPLVLRRLRTARTGGLAHLKQQCSTVLVEHIFYP